MGRNSRILIVGWIGILAGAALAACPASAVHFMETGATPFRIPIVPRFAEAGFPVCSLGQLPTLHGGGLPVKTGCSNPKLESVVATVGTQTAAGTRVGAARLDVCLTNAVPGCTGLTSTQVPDIRVRGNSSDILCNVAATGGFNDPCPGGVGSDYDPKPGHGPYVWGLADPAGPVSCGPPTNLCSPNSDKDFPSTSATPNSDQPCAAPTHTAAACGLFGTADMTATATIPETGNAIRITDHWNNTPSTGDPAGCAVTTSCTATVIDQPFPVPVICAGNNDANLSVGSYCGLNTTANTLVPGVVEAGRAAIVEFGQFQIQDIGVDGIAGSSDDKVFGVQGIFVP